MEQHLRFTYVYMASCKHRDNFSLSYRKYFEGQVEVRLNDTFKIVIIDIYHLSTKISYSTKNKHNI
jgi:hypothetical protein